MKKGDIIYFNPNVRNQEPKLEDKKHPIVCLEDVDSTMDKFLSAILSSGEEPQTSNVENVKLDMNYFDKNPQYPIPGACKQEYLVSMGIWKQIPSLPSYEDGKISMKGLNCILCELLKHTAESRQTDLYTDLIKIVRTYVQFEYVSTDIKTYVKNNHL